MRLGQAMAFIRTAEKLRQKDLAAIIGISNSTLCRVEKGLSCDAASLVKILVWLTSEE